MSKETEHIAVGTGHRLQLRVDERLTVPALSGAFTGFTDMLPVFATAFMVGFIEWTCLEMLRSALPPEFETVGTHIDVSHVAATPIGMTVTADVELISVEGRGLRFHVRCSDETGLIGEGSHERAIVDSAKIPEARAGQEGGKQCLTAFRSERSTSVRPRYPASSVDRAASAAASRFPAKQGDVGPRGTEIGREPYGGLRRLAGLWRLLQAALPHR